MRVLDKLRNWVSPQDRPRTAGYKPSIMPSGWVDFENRPLFDLLQAQKMLRDHQVKFGLQILNGPMWSAQVKAEGPNAEVVKFVQDQWDKIWSTSAEKILRTKNHGWKGFEVCYKLVDGRWEFERLLERHSADTTPIVKRDRVVGVVVKGVHAGARGRVELNGPQGLWLTYAAENGQRWGQSVCEPAYPPWWEKSMRNGAYDLRRLRMIKDAYVGDVIKVPVSTPVFNAAGVAIDPFAIAREVGENRLSGGMIVLPSEHDKEGNPLFDFKGPTPIAGATEIHNWVDNLDSDIFDGMGIPGEVVEAAETGSGFSGRSIPFVTFLSGRDVEWQGYVAAIREQILDVLVALNFGLQEVGRYEIKPVPLLKTMGELMGPMGKPETGEAHPQPGQQPGQPGGFGRPPGQGQPPGQEPMQFSAEFKESEHPRDEATPDEAGIFARVRSRLANLLPRSGAEG